MLHDLVFLNIGFAWNVASNLFIAPRSGQYFLSLSAGFYGNQIFSISIVINGNNILQYTQNGASAKVSTGVDLHSASKLLQLNVDDILTTVVIDANLFSDVTHLKISLIGFYFSPTIKLAVKCTEVHFSNCLKYIITIIS